MKDLTATEIQQSLNELSKKRLDEKIIKAHNLGIKFMLVSKNATFISDSKLEFRFSEDWTNETFESKLDQKIADFESYIYLGILKKYNLI